MAAKALMTAKIFIAGCFWGSAIISNILVSTYAQITTPIVAITGSPVYVLGERPLQLHIFGVTVLVFQAAHGGRRCGSIQMSYRLSRKDKSSRIAKSDGAVISQHVDVARERDPAVCNIVRT
jgi:hypothetical protein